MASRRPGPMPDAGVALLDGRLQLRTADARTLELLGATGVEEGREIWAGILRDSPSSPAPARDHEARAERSLLGLVLRDNGRRLRIECRRLRDGDHEDHAALVQDEAVLEASEQESRLADRLRGIFFFHRAMVHDLRGRLHNLALHIELVGAGPAGGAESAALRDRAGAMKEALAQLGSLLDCLFNQTVPPSEEAERFDLRAVIDEMQLLLEAQAKQQRVTTRVRLPATVVLVEGRRADLRQAYLGALISALETMPSGGELSVTVDPGPAGNHTLTIATTPAAGSEERIYPGASTEPEPGAGLRVVESILEALGGSLMEKSAGPPAGRRIIMLLPGAPPPGREEHRPRER